MAGRCRRFPCEFRAPAAFRWNITHPDVNGGGGANFRFRVGSYTGCSRKCLRWGPNYTCPGHWDACPKLESGWVKWPGPNSTLDLTVTFPTSGCEGQMPNPPPIPPPPPHTLRPSPTSSSLGLCGRSATARGRDRRCGAPGDRHQGWHRRRRRHAAGDPAGRWDMGLPIRGLNDPLLCPADAKCPICGI